MSQLRIDWRMRRRDFGNTPNTSKSLRLLVSSRMLARVGQGGRIDAFRYSIPSDVLAVIAPGGIEAQRGAAAASPPAGVDDAAGPSGAVRDPVTSTGTTSGVQATPLGDPAPPNAPAKRSPAEACTRLTHAQLPIEHICPYFCRGNAPTSHAASCYMSNGKYYLRLPHRCSYR